VRKGGRYARTVAAPDPLPGRRIITASWTGDAVFAATAIPAALGVEVLDGAAIGMALGLFAISLVVWCWAFGIALARTTRGDDVVVGSMFLLQGPVPTRVRVHLFGSLAVCLAVTAATAAAEPFGVLVPMLPLGLAGLWGARHGTYPPRPAAGAATGGRRSSGRAGQ
jgi:hypothetical protein